MVARVGKSPEQPARDHRVGARLDDPDSFAIDTVDLHHAPNPAREDPTESSFDRDAAVLLADALFEFERPGMAAATAEAIRRIDEGPLTSDEFVKARARLAARVESQG